MRDDENDDRDFGDIGTRLLFENDRLRVWEMKLAPGESSGLHRHENDYVMIQLAGDRIAALFEADSADEFGGADLPGRRVDAAVVPLQVVWGGRGGVETAINPGEETFHELVIELKD